MLRQGPGERCVHIEVGAKIRLCNHLRYTTSYIIYILYICLSRDVIMNSSHGVPTRARSKYRGMVGRVRSMVIPDAMAFM